MPDPPPYTYRPDVLERLLTHGVRPTCHTPPERVREYVRELYKYEIRRLRERMLGREFPRRDYAGRVDALRRRYSVLSLLPSQFLDTDARSKVSTTEHAEDTEQS